MSKPIPDFSKENYTYLYIASDKASKEAQICYIRIIAAQLISTVLASGFAIYSYQSHTLKMLTYIVSGILLLASLLITVILLSKKFENTWYQGRALAESCKTLTWRFMTCSELFEQNLSIQQAKEKFTSRIGELSDKFQELNRVLDADILRGSMITELMMAVRQLSLNERKNYYLKNRIEDQQNWYSKEAKKNKRMSNLWFFVIMVSQALSLICVINLIVNPTSNWKLVGLFTTTTAAATSWLQIKRCQELKQAYTTACQELGLIAALAENDMNENDFSKFVLDSENAISREHTLWLAQRRK